MKKKTYFKKLWTTKRPYLDKFIKNISKKFNLILFTASEKSYADSILKIIDPLNEFFILKFYRHNCLFLHNYLSLKNLDFIQNLNLAKTICVDNSPVHFYKNCENIVPIIPFFGNPHDSELIKLETFLLYLHSKNDFRQYIKKQFFVKEFFTKQNFDSLLKTIQDKYN